MSQEKKESKITPVAIMLLICGIVSGIGSMVVGHISALQTRIRGLEARVTALQADKAQLQSRVSSLKDDKTQLQSISRHPKISSYELGIPVEKLIEEDLQKKDEDE